MKPRRPNSVVPAPHSSSANAAAHPLDWAPGAGAVNDVLREMNARLGRQRRRRARRAVAAAVMLAGVGLAWAFIARERPGVSDPRTSTPIASLPRHETLPDGSVVEFRNEAKIVAAFTADLRRVTLERGEAHFNVAKNPARPFVVRAGGVEFRAVGTAFTIDLAATKVEMFVTEGKVAVAVADTSSTVLDSPAPVLIVEAGNHVLVPIQGAAPTTPVVTPVSAAQLSQRLAWRAPKLEFTATPLAEAIAQINAHAGVAQHPLIRLGDDALATVRISGILRADNIDTLIGVLEADYGIKAERRGGEEIILRLKR